MEHQHIEELKPGDKCLVWNRKDLKREKTGKTVYYSYTKKNIPYFTNNKTDAITLARNINNDINVKRGQYYSNYEKVNDKNLNL